MSVNGTQKYVNFLQDEKQRTQNQKAMNQPKRSVCASVNDERSLPISK